MAKRSNAEYRPRDRCKPFRAHFLTMNSLDSFEGIVDDLNCEIERNEDGSVHCYMVKQPGEDSSFRCRCGCNVFHKNIGDENRYICNSCDDEYVGS